MVGVLEAAAVALALLSVGTLFAGLHRNLELLSHFKAQYFFSSLFLLVIFAMLRRRNFTLLMFALSLLNAWFVLPWYLGNNQPGTSGETIKLLHANVLRTNTEPAALLAQIVVENPDLVILQEMSPVWLRAMQGLSAEYPYSVAEARDGAFGIGLFSKLPFEDARILHAPPIDLPEIRAIVKLGAYGVNIVSSHPMSPIGRAGIDARNQQLSALGQDLAAMPGPTILIGDLNISMWAPTYELFEQTTGLQNARKGFGLVPTFPVFLPVAGIPIDHCLVSDEIHVLEFRTGSKIGSDHLPVVVRLGFRSSD